MNRAQEVIQMLKTRTPTPSPEALAEHELDLTMLPLEIDIPFNEELTPEEFTLGRRDGVGGSDVATILGLSPYSNKRELLINKLSPTITQDELEIRDNAAVKKGHDLEPLAIDKAARLTGIELAKPQHQFALKGYPHIKINFDGVALAPEGYIPVEVKIITPKGEKNYNPMKAVQDERDGIVNPIPVPPMTDNYVSRAMYYGIPINYYAQLQLQMLGCNAPYGYIAALHEKDWILRMYYVWRNDKLINEFIVEATKFWNEVEFERMRSPYWQ